MEEREGMMECWNNGMMGFSIFHYSNFDNLVKNLKRLLSVIPAQAGIQSF